ncbi:proline-rich protein PRCC [Eucyclogobius newberryi]|uniref:proline-rich protein PRCC n=1 Tax=Eucyclogobius newberryi TaxID=166745 RepID=UPI003B5A45DE
MSLVAYGSSGESDSEETSGSALQSKGGLFSVLPAPKKSTLVNTGPKLTTKSSTVSEKGASKDEIVLQKGSLFSSLPKPKKRNEPVRISAPQIQKRDSDSDDDEQPASKKKLLGGGTGLSSLLPQPRNMSVKEIDRPLIPYTLTKRQESKVAKVNAPSALLSSSASPSAIKAAAKSAAMQLARQIANDDHDEEEISPENYFSLEDNSQLAPVAVPEAEPEHRPVIDPVQFGTPDGPGHSDAPLDFGGNAEEGGAWAGQYPEGMADPEAYSQGYYNQPYYQDPNVDQGETGGTGGTGETGETEEEEPGNSAMFDEEAFMRLQGKRNRGKEEITFLEIKGDDQLSGTQQWLTKSITEEQQNRSSFSKKRGGMPTGQQRRKHQITYLIHQAKERELELKNSWAENKLTRRQTQAKYGF